MQTDLAWLIRFVIIYMGRSFASQFGQMVRINHEQEYQIRFNVFSLLEFTQKGMN